ncbi:hypothetical protein [Lyngbya sp. CCY1209]|uniref:hypothetical protein n=1 Tax=Lyngbya sp. CCY1209 TaxID=2886103 RepID=UPI002D20F978|nr:hypothetical protein [Lyngbya sp. CCY1209]MEB3886264.1 hypothetical protein [Lyngbya sp. CCY1209]
MPVQQSHYETLLAEYSNSTAVIALLQQHRPYFEMIPSLRRPEESLITLPLPIVRLRDGVSYAGHREIAIRDSAPIAPDQAVCLPCDIAVIMCDPEWKVKVGAEIFVFIHRPQEDLSDLLRRWRLTQVYLDGGYEWVMPHHYEYIYSQEAEKIYPLFVLFSETPERIKRGLRGAHLPFVIQHPNLISEPAEEDSLDDVNVEEYHHWQGWSGEDN